MKNHRVILPGEFRQKIEKRVEHFCRSPVKVSIFPNVAEQKMSDDIKYINWHNQLDTKF